MIRWPVLIMLTLSLSSLANVTGKISIKFGKKVIKNPNAVVWVKNPPKSSPRKKKTHRMNQKNKKFTPGVMAIQRGDSVIFENKDKVYHNVFSLNPKNKFDLGVYRGSTKYSQDFSKVLKKNIKPKKTFKNTGKVNLFCNIHANMKGMLYVFDHPYYSKLGRKGNFKLPKLPHGKYTLVVDGKKFKAPQEFSINYKGKPINLKIDGSKILNKKENQHTRKDGSAFPLPEEDDEFY